MDYPWNSGKLKDGWPEIEGCVGSLLHFEDNACLGVLGSFSVLAAGNGQILGISATHSFDELKKFQATRNPMPFGMGVPISASKHESLPALANVRAMLRLGSDILLAQVLQVWTNDDHDAAIFAAKLDTWPDSFPRMEIDLDYPVPTEDVALVGYIHSPQLGEAEKWSLERAIVLRRGKVKSVQFERNRLGKVLTFETSIPAEPGLSGSPVFRLPEAGEPMALMGVVSSDFSEPSAFSSHAVSGMSTCSMAWPVLSLPTRVFLQETMSEIEHFIELVNSGLVKTVARRSELSFERDGQFVVLSNRDNSTTPPNTYAVRSPA